tara:strand:- start:299 stop:865 length:567 start_codon:yes stop_codon:yes gene_type:complete
MELEKVANKLMEVSEEGVSTISKLCREQVQLEQDIRELEGAIKLKKARLKEVSEELLPTSADEHQIKEITTEDGYNVTINDFYDARISATDLEQREKAFAWLVANKFDYLIKNKVEIIFERKEHNIAMALVEDLKKRGLAKKSSTKTWVEYQSLKAFVKEQIQKGEVKLPFDLLNIYEGRRAKVTKKI